MCKLRWRGIAITACILIFGCIAGGLNLFLKRRTVTQDPTSMVGLLETLAEKTSGVLETTTQTAQEMKMLPDNAAAEPSAFIDTTTEITGKPIAFLETTTETIEDLVAVTETTTNKPTTVLDATKEIVEKPTTVLDATEEIVVGTTTMPETTTDVVLGATTMPETTTDVVAGATTMPKTTTGRLSIVTETTAEITEAPTTGSDATVRRRQTKQPKSSSSHPLAAKLQKQTQSDNGVRQCVDGKFGLNFCSEWCNVPGFWPECGMPMLGGADIRNHDHKDYVCLCEGCNGCRAPSVPTCPKEFPKCHSSGVCIAQSCADGCEWKLNVNYMLGFDEKGTMCNLDYRAESSAPPVISHPLTKPAASTMTVTKLASSVKRCNGCPDAECPKSFPKCHPDGVCVIKSCAGGCEWERDVNWIRGYDGSGYACMSDYKNIASLETGSLESGSHCILPKGYFGLRRPRILMVHLSSLKYVRSRLYESYIGWIKEFLDEPEDDAVVTFVSSKEQELRVDTKIVPYLPVALTPCPDTYKVGSVCRFYEAIRYIATRMHLFDWVYFYDDDTIVFPHNLRHVLMEKRCQLKDRPFSMACFGCGGGGFCGGCGIGISVSAFRKMQNMYPLDSTKWIQVYRTDFSASPVWGPTGWHPNFDDPSNPLQGVAVKFLEQAWQLHKAGDLWHDVAVGRLVTGAGIENVNLIGQGVEGWPKPMAEYEKMMCRCDHPPILYHYVDSVKKKAIKEKYERCHRTENVYRGPGLCSWDS